MKKLTFLSLFVSLAIQAQLPNKINKQEVLQSQTDYYRVVAKGFICNRETSDDVMERDGKRDEIYLSATSTITNRQGFSIPETTVKNRTRTMGDVNGRAKEERRSMAGSAFGNLGGIQTGDNIPDVEPWKNQASPSGDLLPFILWEGILEDHQSVIITPTIMEYDGPDDFLTNLWENSFIGQLGHLVTSVAATPFNLFTSNVNAPNNIGLYNDSAPGIYPIPTVMQQFPDQFYRVKVDLLTKEQKIEFQRQHAIVTNSPADRPIGSTENFYNPLVMKLDAASMERLSHTDFGYGKGIVPIRFIDTSGLNGDYTVFYAMEKVTETAQKGRINVSHPDVFDPIVSYSLRNVWAHDKVADVLAGGTTDNTHIVLNNDLNIDSQKFNIKKANDFYFYLNNVYNRLNLDILNKNDSNGSNIVSSSADNSEIQQWAFIRYCDGSWIIRNVKTKKVIEVYNAATNILAPLGQMEFNNGRNQRWFIEKE
jgi:hypothetical protein